jgi:hypothetical protein
MRSRRASHGSVRPLNCGVSRQLERAVGSVRLGYFEGFKGRDTLLIDGDVEGLGELIRTLNVLVLAQQDVVLLHSLPFVSAANRVEVNAHWAQRDFGMSKINGMFKWRRNSTGWAAVVEQILGVKKQGCCHQYLDAPSDEVAVMVSSGEYGEPWPQLGAAPWAR